MDSSVRQVHERLEPYLQALAQHQFRSGVGLDVGAPPRMVEAERPELFHAAREWFEQARDDEEKASRRKFLEFIAGQVRLGVCREADSELQQRLHKARVLLDNEVIPLADALERMPQESARPRRLQLEHGIAESLWELRPLFRRSLDANQRAAERLGFPSPAPLFALTSGLEVAPVLNDAEKMLRRTDDAFRDVLGYLLHKLDAKLRPLPSGDGHRADVQAALGGVFPEVFRREDVVPAMQRWMSEFGLTPHAEGRIRPDAEAREGRRARAFVAPVQVPEEVRLAAIPTSGLEATGAWLRAMGAAQALAHVSPKLPVEDRRLGDASLSEAWSLVFGHLLTDALWVRRYLHLPLPVARDVARLAAFSALWRLRQAAARLQLTESLEDGGPDESLAERYTEAQRAALFVEVDRRFVFFERDPQRSALRRLRGFALEARLRPVLEQRFDEDFWRNPGSAAFLEGLWTLGGREDAAKLSESVTSAPLSVEGAGLRLVRILGA